MNIPFHAKQIEQRNFVVVILFYWRILKVDSIANCSSINTMARGEHHIKHVITVTNIAWKSHLWNILN